MTDKIRQQAIEAAAKAVEDQMASDDNMPADIALAAVIAFEAAMWRPIEDDTPLDQDFLLGWGDSFLKMRWQMEVGYVGMSSTVAAPYSNGWRHGQATHFRPITSPQEPSDAK